MIWRGNKMNGTTLKTFWMYRKSLRKVNWG